LLLSAQQANLNAEVQRDVAFNLARNDLRWERYESAERRLRELLIDEPSNWQFRHLLGKALLHSGTLDGAVAELEYAARIFLSESSPWVPGYGRELFNDLVDAFSALGDCAKAAVAYARAAEFDPRASYTQVGIRVLAEESCK